MGKSFIVNLRKNKSNGQINISLPKKKLRGQNIDLKKFKKIKISIEGFE